MFKNRNLLSTLAIVFFITIAIICMVKLYLARPAPVRTVGLDIDDIWDDLDKRMENIVAEGSKIQQDETQGGDFGLLVVPELGIHVPLYGETGSAEDDQKIVNDEDSALVLTSMYRGQLLVADHDYQEFGELEQAIPGNTIAYVKKNDGSVTAYVCTYLFKGHNRKTDLTTEDGESIQGMNGDKGLIIYTCNGRWENVFITFWQPVISG